MKSKLSTAKKSKTTTFSRVFHLRKIDNFLGKSKFNFWTKNEDFEQCVQEENLWEVNSPSDDYDKQIGLRLRPMLLGAIVILPGVVLG